MRMLIGAYTLKTVTILALIISITMPAKAESWTQYLQIQCEPSIQFFSVQPAGTWEQEAAPPGGFFKLSHGWSADSDGVKVKTEGSDSFAKCTIPHRKGDILFEVVRIRSYPPGGCGGCGVWGGLFQVRMNGEVIVEDNLAKARLQAIRSVRFEGEDILICNSPQGPSGRRRSDSDGRIAVSCKVIEGDQFRDLIQKTPE